MAELSAPHWKMRAGLCFHQNCRQSSRTFRKVGDVGSFHGSRRRRKTKEGEGGFKLSVQCWAPAHPSPG